MGFCQRLCEKNQNLSLKWLPLAAPTTVLHLLTIPDRNVSCLAPLGLHRDKGEQGQSHSSVVPQLGRSQFTSASTPLHWTLFLIASVQREQHPSDQTQLFFYERLQRLPHQDRLVLARG